MEQKTYDEVLAEIDRERAAAAIAGMLIYLGGLLDWGSDEFMAVQEMLEGARPYSLPEFGDQDDEALKFWGTLSLELGNDTDYEPAPRYVATINVPGYLPMDDDPPVFDTTAEAWDYLREERQRAEDDDETTDEYSATLETLGAMATGEAGIGSVVGPTPGYLFPLTDPERHRLGALRAEFEAAGGRGVELAEEIDRLAAREDVTADHDLGLAYSVSIVEED